MFKWVGNYSYGTIGFFLSKAMKKENINMYGDGELKRTFTHVYDICNSTIKFNIVITKNELSQLLKKAFFE